MNILVLDDNEILRGAPEDPTYSHDYRNDTFTQTRNVRRFVELFFWEVWDEVWFDHDLGLGLINGRTATKDIYNYMRGSGRVPVSDQMLLRVITMNPSSADTMVSDLEQAFRTDENSGRFCIVRTPISSMEWVGISRGNLINY